MSLFRDSKSIADDEMTIRVLTYGPRNWGKTHFGLTFPEPAVLDLENRVHAFRDLFDFKMAGLETLDDVREGIKEIRSGRLGCKTVLMDSVSVLRLRFREKHTKTNDNGKLVTNHAAVNTDMLGFANLIFGLKGMNVFVTAHQVDDLQYSGDNNVKKVGVKGLYDPKIEFAFDLILRGEWRGPQRFAIVEKSVYAQKLPIGTALRDPSYASIMAVIRGKNVQPLTTDGRNGAAQTNGAPERPQNGSSQAERSPAPAPSSSHVDAISQTQKNAIDSICQTKKVGLTRLAEIIKDAAGREAERDALSYDEAKNVIGALTKLVPA